MKDDGDKILIDSAMLELFRLEVETNAHVLTNGLIGIEESPSDLRLLESLMRAAHSIKGAARLVNVPDVVDLAHIMEDYLVKVQRGETTLCADCTDMLLKGVDMICTIAAHIDGKGSNLNARQREEYAHLLAAMREGRFKVNQNSAQTERVDGTRNILEPSPGLTREDDGFEGSSEESKSHIGSEELLRSISESVPGVDNGTTAKSHEKAEKSAFEIDLLADPSMMELFRLEVQQNSASLIEGLLSLESKSFMPESIEPLMRAAHSIKGAARLMGVQAATQLAHRMEDCMVAAQHGKMVLGPAHIDVLLKAVDILGAIAAQTQHPGGDLSAEQKVAYTNLLTAMDGFLQGDNPAKEPLKKREKVQPKDASAQLPSVSAPSAGISAVKVEAKQSIIHPASENKSGANAPVADRVLRVSAEQLNRLMGLAGESMVEARWLRPYAESMLRLKHRQVQLITHLDKMRECVDSGYDPEKIKRLLREAQAKATECRYVLADRMAELESFDRRAVNLSSRLHREVVASRMRPFADGVQGLPRMVRDVARSLGKQVQLQVDGQATMVDRDILEKIEASLNHLLRNAVDHGIESPEEREQAGKPVKGTIRLAAYHQSGMLTILVEDDGRGVDVERLRVKVVERKLVTAEMAANLSNAELMEFLFLPGFSTRSQVTEISGRGVGLDVVHDVVQEMRGMVRATSQLGKGTRFQLQLPLTLSVIPALLVEIAGEPYAFPLARIERILEIHSDEIREIEGHQYISAENSHIGLVAGMQILGYSKNGIERGDVLSVVVLGERKSSYGVVVDRFLGERNLVVQVLPRLLGKIKDIGAAALMENGAPLLIIDVDDMLRSIEKVVAMGRVNRVDADSMDETSRVVKRILIVDDSITVREVERKLLEASGYEVELAMDGMDGWNVLRENKFDLVITDIDMPRMDGIELVRMIRQDPNLKGMPVMIVSYKDREDDRARGLEAGANYYLTKGSFHDETLREAVIDLIGEAA